MIWSRWWLILTLSGAPIWAEAQTARLVGRVLDSRGQPIPGVEVRLGAQRAQTDPSGSYVLENLPADRQEVQLSHAPFESLATKVWLQEGLTTALDAVLTLPVQEREQTKVGLLGVGSLPKTDLLAQRLAEDLVRLKGFPLVEPLVAFDQSEVMPMVEVLRVPLAEILDRDRQKPELVAKFFRYLGVKALVVARTDALIQPDPGSVNTKVRFSIRLELWQFQGDTLEIRYLAQERTEEKADGQLNEAEANDILQIQATKLANLVSQRWQGPDNPWQALIGNNQAQPTPRQVNTLKVEIRP